MNVPRGLDGTTARTIEIHPPSLGGKPLSFADFGNLGGYLALLLYCLDKVQSDPKGKMPYPPPVED